MGWVYLKLHSIRTMGVTNSVTFDTEETGSNAPERQPEADPNRADFLDPKFKTVEEQAKAYREAQSALTRANQELAKARGEKPAEQSSTPEKKPDEPKKPDDLQIKDEPPKKQDEAAEEVAKAAGVDLAPYQTEYTSTGDVSDESRAKIADGLTKVLGPNARQIVDEFIEARKVVHQNDTRMYMDAAGGQENYQTMVIWAKDALPKEQIAAYNSQVNSGDRHAAMFAIEGLRAKYEASNGKLPQRRVTGNSRPSGNTNGFASSAEMTRAMKDPRYKTDQAYRDDVAARIAASNL